MLGIGAGDDDGMALDAGGRPAQGRLSSAAGLGSWALDTMLAPGEHTSVPPADASHPAAWLPADAEEGEGGDEAAAAVAAVLNGAVAQVVYRNAIAAFPDSVPFRAKFLEILAPLHFPGRVSLEVRPPLHQAAHAWPAAMLLSMCACVGRVTVKCDDKQAALHGLSALACTN